MKKIILILVALLLSVTGFSQRQATREYRQIREEGGTIISTVTARTYQYIVSDEDIHSGQYETRMYNYIKPHMGGASKYWRIYRAPEQRCREIPHYLDLRVVEESDEVMFFVNILEDVETGDRYIFRNAPWSNYAGYFYILRKVDSDNILVFSARR